jgi:hypothetical protein
VRVTRHSIGRRITHFLDFGPSALPVCLSTCFRHPLRPEPPPAATIHASEEYVSAAYLIRPPTARYFPFISVIDHSRFLLLCFLKFTTRISSKNDSVALHSSANQGDPPLVALFNAQHLLGTFERHRFKRHLQPKIIDSQIFRERNSVRYFIF